MASEPIRLNKFIAQHTDISRRGADSLISEGKVFVNGKPAQAGQQISANDTVMLDGKLLQQLKDKKLITILLNKPVGYVCSRNGQGSLTVYDLLPENLKHLNSVGRLDKNSSGLLLMTNNGDLANTLTHPGFRKVKVYEVKLNKPLQPLHQQMISDYGITLEDGISKFQIQKQNDSTNELVITMSEGRNRQIRRTFEALGYDIKHLHRTTFGNYNLDNVKRGKFIFVK